MKNNKVANIIKYNTKKNIKNKWFIALNILFFVICIIAINFSEINNFINENSKDTVIEIVDSKNLMYENLLNKFSTMDKLQIKKVDKLIYDESNFESNRILIETNYSTENILEVKVISSELINDEFYNPIKDSTKEIRNEIFAKQNNISKQAMSEILNEESIETIVIEEDETEHKWPIFMGLWTITYMTIPLILSKFSKEIFAEKTSKSSEYILTNISSKEYILIKIGTTLLNILIQGVAVLIYYLLACFFKSLLTGETITAVINLNEDLVKIIILQFILYVPYMIIMLFVQMIMSSKASDSTSTSSTEMISVLIFFITSMIPFYMVMYELETLNLVYYFLACIPLFSTFIIPSLYIFHGVGIIHTIIASIVYVITIGIMLKVIPNKIKNNILDYKNVKKKNKENLNKENNNPKIKFELERSFFIRNISKYAMLIGFVIIVYLVLAMFILPLVVEPITFGLFENNLSKENISLITSIINGILSLYIPIKILEIYNKKEKISSNKESKLKWFLMSIPFVVLIFAIQILVGKNLGVNSTNETIENTSYLLIFIRLVLVPAIFEELLFRKALFNASKKQGLIFAIIISSLLFGIIHLNFYQAIGATFAGIVFAIMVYKTGSIMTSIILHAIVNGYSFFTNILWIDNPVARKIINVFVIGFAIIGGVILIENILINKNKTKNSLKKTEKNNEAYDNAIVKTTLLFSNYYFIFAIALLIICFAINQKYMGMLM